MTFFKSTSRMLLRSVIWFDQLDVGHLVLESVMQFVSNMRLVVQL
jgi:hypothetical protein